MSATKNLEDTTAIFVDFVKRIQAERAKMIVESKRITEAKGDRELTRPEARMDYSDLD